MDTTQLERLHDLARRQHGLVAARQWRLIGIAATTLIEHLKRRGWRSVGPGVWLAPGAPEPDLFAVRIAVLAVGPPVAAARWTAAALHGIHRDVPVTQVVVPAGRRATALPRVQTLRTRTWSDDDLVWIRGIPVTTLSRTLCDLAAVADLEALRRLVIDGRQKRLVSLEALVEQLSRAGRIRGRRKLERIIRELGGDQVDSWFEHLVVQWLRSLGYRVETQYRLRTRTGVVHLDIALVDLGIGIECKGFGSHSERKHLNVDARRGNAIKATRTWEVLELTWDEFTQRRQQFLDDLLELAGNLAA